MVPRSMLSGRACAADAHSVPGAPAGSSRTAPCNTHTGGLQTVFPDPDSIRSADPGPANMTHKSSVPDP
jgi:hypothetical protein